MVLLFSDFKTLRFHQQRLASPASPASPASSASPARACRPTSPSLKIKSRPQTCQKAHPQKQCKNPRNSPSDAPANPSPLSRAGAAQNAHHFPFHGPPAASSACTGSAAPCGSPIELRFRALLQRTKGEDPTQPFGQLAAAGLTRLPPAAANPRRIKGKIIRTGPETQVPVRKPRDTTTNKD